MKRFLSAALAVIAVFCLICFSSCGKTNEEETTVKTDNVTAEKDFSDVFSLRADSAEISAGEKIRVYIHSAGCRNFAAAGFNLKAQGCAVIKNGNKVSEDGAVYSMGNSETGNDYYGGFYVAAATDLNDEDVYYFDLVTDDDAKSGDTVTLSLDVSVFEVAEDESGDKTENYAAGISVDDLVLTVK